MLNGNIVLKDQECEGSYDFRNTTKYMTKGFKSKFGDEAEELFSQSIDMIMEKNNFPTPFDIKTGDKVVLK